MYSIEVRRRAFTLLTRGWTTEDVGAELGVSGSIIRRWRGQVGGVVREQVVSSGWHLSRDERCEIARLNEDDLGVREIARRLGRSPSTISRELRRPQRAAGTPGCLAGRAAGRGYQPEAAHQAAVNARRRPRPTRLSQHGPLRAEVQSLLDQHLSPEQITGRLRLLFPDDEQMQISHETIYRGIYIRPRGELRAQLRTGRDRRRRRNTRETRDPDRRRGQIVAAVPIGERPAEVEDRLIPGHYEGDLMVGPVGTTAAIGTLVERTSGHLTAFGLPVNRTTVACIAGLTTALTRTGWPMTTLTWDRGKEMAGHAQFTIDTGIQVYFADPHAPWQRGTNENTNGLLREYFPKGTDLAALTDATLQAVVDQLNNRPRKRLGYRTPNEVLADILTNDQQTIGVAVTD